MAREPAASPARGRIAVFRALLLGDLLCATPVLRALKGAWPRSELTLIGLPWAREFAARLPEVDHFKAFPGFPGLTETTPVISALPHFIEQMQRHHVDLLLQLQGNGHIVNSLLASFGARQIAGFVEPGGYCRDPALHIAWPTRGHEIERLLCLTDHLGVARRGTQLEFPLHEADRTAARRLLPALDTAPFACIHPGAHLPTRRWPAQCFAAVADALADHGLDIVLTGTVGEASLTAQVAARMRHEAIDLPGCNALFTLGALIERCRLVVCNDTGVSHIAAALGTPSVVIGCGSEVERWAPLDHARHRMLSPGPPQPEGPDEPARARDLEPGEVIDAALALAESPCHETP
jgi:ADP-heptose:LPS heptosyltransferase